MLYLPQDSTSSAVFYHITSVHGAFTDLLVLCRRTDCLCFEFEFERMDSQRC